MIESAYEQAFCIQSPLRLGISSANASDNHLRSKEQGGKTLNIAVNLQQDQQERAQPPLEVTARGCPNPSSSSARAPEASRPTLRPANRARL